ncbi:kinetochore complex Sim4 subunit Fta1-domain-containing protein [Bipolaris maydis]|uniref:kinetochore complex Sim4 subunit Fta1-domain-containing protein n=1 Tax=Cochliobolus heterostrophus TaxID=5016 RepID=UPI0024D7F8D3|nr:kinetochore complex Sim4 subunit Fta1-domain-containing protein [Bipolaris maydis]
MAYVPPYPLLNRTYNLYRASPLHHGDSFLLSNQSMRAHAKRLKEQLKGDNVRGVQVDFAGGDETAKLGPLEECRWEVLGDEDAWIDRRLQSEDPDAPRIAPDVTPDRARGIHVSLEYEKNMYNALLLRDPHATSSPNGFTSLPLLLVKMPAPIREIFLNYIRTAFDAHVAPLRLPSSFITSSLETFFSHLTARSSTLSIQDTIKQLHVQLTFPNATSLLKHIEVTIAAEDVAGFVQRGKLLKTTHSKPFTAALSNYLNRHLALDLSHPKVQVSRISCASFHLGIERLKIVAPDTLPDTSITDQGSPSQSQDSSAAQLAVHQLYTLLVREATGSGKFLPEDLATDARENTPSSTASARRKRAVSTTATTNGTTKKTKGKGKGVAKQTNGDTPSN